jgi:ribosomal protein L3 glutamine methyltransferase
VELTTLRAALESAEASFAVAKLHFGHGTNNAWDEAVALALAVLALPPDVDSSVGERILTESEKKTFFELVQRRITERIPVPYLTHEAWFSQLKFYVDERVIIPRSPFAELINKKFQPWIGKNPVKRILDLCTGSGCLAILCAKNFPEATIDAVDISPEALQVAKHNVTLHQCEQQVRLIQSDLFSACEKIPYDIIISNPPYVDDRELADLPVEYRFEPHMALTGGVDGLVLVKTILRQAPSYLANKGLLFMEVGNSMETLQNQYPTIPFTWLSFEQGGEGVFMLSAEDKACWQKF